MSFHRPFDGLRESWYVCLTNSPHGRSVGQDAPLGIIE
jgi:hypothetical protein